MPKANAKPLANNIKNVRTKVMNTCNVIQYELQNKSRRKFHKKKCDLLPSQKVTRCSCDIIYHT